MMAIWAYTCGKCIKWDKNYLLFIPEIPATLRLVAAYVALPLNIEKEKSWKI